ncbi:MAG: hypothetical protein PHZ26_00310 [Candidatus Gracilibacteria bacterium]|nr:hypothetical protein [Candidatus Gracilibacteria bacterium]MDD2908179.1 hypothetical protein [Candidatus Gracilibacteria bacterium]
MLLHNAYIGLHLESESEKIVKDGLDSQDFGETIIQTKNPHLTLDYLGSLESDTLGSLVYFTRFMIFRAAKFPITLGNPSHLLSNITNENIFYLPVSVENGLFKDLKAQTYSINTPHVTILKGKNLTEEQINKTLVLIKNIIPHEGLYMSTKEVFTHSKTEDGKEIIKSFPCLL